jgi:hypothetical protein
MTERKFYTELAKRFGLTAYQLDLLFRFKRGDHISGDNSGPVLDRKGYTALNRPNGCGYDRGITDAGLQVCKSARELGY